MTLGIRLMDSGRSERPVSWSIKLTSNILPGKTPTQGVVRTTALKC